MAGQVVPKFAVGQRVTHVNDYGVRFPGKTITGVVLSARFGVPIAYDIEPTDTPWFPIAEKNLHAEVSK